MKILIVEDDSFKYSKVAELLREIFHDAELLHRDNVHGAINYVRSESPDLILLDMSLPSHPAVVGEGSPVSMPAGGIEIILELKMLKKIGIKTIVLTQYPDVEIEYEYYSIIDSERAIKSLYGMQALSVVHYDNDSNEWKDKLKNILTKS
ncbi:response regulator [Pandoraea communis]|uniref:response regulator n=1 Tax=Pandoraea communis TaxID=2508297 RepID=UPI0025A5728F|nr:response regulator [Pandoraea communis]MDM8359741.1 response regulator [Pandoraea communis]